MKTCACGNVISALRVKLLPNTNVCAACSRETKKIPFTSFEDGVATTVMLPPTMEESVQRSQQLAQGFFLRMTSVTEKLKIIT